MSDCTCHFRNPKMTVTAICIKDNKLMALRRSIEPHKGEWDFCGGFAEEGETAEEALHREVGEELGVPIKRFQPIGMFPGLWQDVPTINHAFLVDIDNPVISDDENSEVGWVPFATPIAFDSNQDVLEKLVEMHEDIHRVRELSSQLDKSVVVDEYDFYAAQLQGFLAREYDVEKLIGMGWVFPRQTMLRHQAVIEDMIVDEEYRGAGVGQKILEQLIEWSVENGVKVLELTTNPKRVAANALYQKLGFWLHETNHYLKNL